MFWNYPEVEAEDPKGHGIGHSEMVDVNYTSIKDRKEEMEGRVGG